MTSFGSTDSATRHLKPSVGPMHATSERVARGRMYDCCTCPFTVSCHSGSASQAGSTVRATLTLQRQSQSNASGGLLALAVGSCFLCLLSLQQQRK